MYRLTPQQQARIGTLGDQRRSRIPCGYDVGFRVSQGSLRECELNATPLGSAGDLQVTVQVRQLLDLGRQNGGLGDVLLAAGDRVSWLIEPTAGSPSGDLRSNDFSIRAH